MAEKKKKKDGKKEKIEISLWINKTKYKFGCLCTFCQKIKAIYHCPECSDFYCNDCDITSHSTKKRKDHVRSLLSLLDLETASKFVTFAVRYHGKLLMLQKMCRAVFRRYFDPETLCHYYYNPVYKITSWRKPYCLRKTELFPFMTTDYAASKIQNMYYLWKMRVKVNEHILLYYKKIFDRTSGIFYYAFYGKSTLIPRQSWNRPKFLGRRGYLRDILPIYTKDVAALIIQRKWRAIMVRQMLIALLRCVYDQMWDPVRGRYMYFNRETEEYIYEKPKLLRGNLWDPDNVPEWDEHRVSIFLRRIGLKMYVKRFMDYGVTGKSLVLIDDEDFDNLEIFSKVHRKKIQIEVAKFYVKKKSDVYTEEHAARREAIRKRKLFTITSTKIQCAFRCYRARKDLAMRREIKRIKEFEVEFKKEIVRQGIWWINREDIPTKKLFTNSGHNIADILPPLKIFGRKRDHLSVKGWGKFNLGKWAPLSLTEKFQGDAHVTQFLSTKLSTNGYNYRRQQRYRGIIVNKDLTIDEQVDEEKKKKKLEELEKKLKEAKDKKLAIERAIRLGLPIEEDLDDSEGL